MKPCAEWPPRRRRKPLLVFIPASVLSVEPSLELKTVKAGVIARALAAFRVDEVVVYTDEDSEMEDVRLLGLLLSYAETPPHLRRVVYPLMPELSAAGLMPPLRTYSHEPPGKPRRGDLIEGYIDPERPCRVFLGRQLGWWRLRPCRDRGAGRVAVRILDPSKRLVEEASWGEYYPGYRVRSEKNLRSAIEYATSRGLALIATSRRGSCADQGILCDVSREYHRRGAAVFFGGPKRGLFEMEGFRPEDFDFILNTIPSQGVKTVRTEEALWVSLSLINAFVEAGCE